MVIFESDFVDLSFVISFLLLAFFFFCLRIFVLMLDLMCKRVEIEVNGIMSDVGTHFPVHCQCELLLSVRVFLLLWLCSLHHHPH